MAEHARHLFTSHDLHLRGDDGEWQALGHVLGVPVSRIRLVRQVHKAQVAVIAIIPAQAHEADGAAERDWKPALPCRPAG